MDAAVGPVILGIILAVIGVANMKGNIASIHWYHRRRVTQQDIKPFGRLVGLGTLIIGAALAVFGGLSFAAEKMQNAAFTVAGAVVLVAAVVAGIAVSIYAMLKYNRGIF